MCSIEQFRKASVQQQSRYLDEYGVYLNLCIYRQSEVLVLYSLFNHYIEVHHDVDCTKILKIKCISSLKGLDPFLKLINIDEITSLLKVK